jgi:hypothetical protein
MNTTGARGACDIGSIIHEQSRVAATRDLSRARGQIVKSLRG